MKQFSVLLMVLMVLATFGCRGRKHDVAYYQQMVDSIRKAEQVKEIQRKAGIYTNPADAFFDTLAYHSLPIQSEGDMERRVSGFTEVPLMLNEHFAQPPSAHLRALRLPTAWRRQVVLVSEERDSLHVPCYYLYVMDEGHQPMDVLLIYEQRREKRQGADGRAYMEYFITSRYEITLMHYFQADDAPRPHLDQMRRYVITREGKFEEVVIEL